MQNWSQQKEVEGNISSSHLSSLHLPIVDEWYINIKLLCNSLNTQCCFLHPHFCICSCPPQSVILPSPIPHLPGKLFSLHNPTKESPPLCSGICFAVYSLVLLEATRKLFQQMESFLTFFPGEKLWSPYDSSFFLSSPWGHKEVDRTERLNWTGIQRKIFHPFTHSLTVRGTNIGT